MYLRNYIIKHLLLLLFTFCKPLCCDLFRASVSRRDFKVWWYVITHIHTHAHTSQTVSVRMLLMMMRFVFVRMTGDRLLEVDRSNLRGVTHHQAVEFLKRTGEVYIHGHEHLLMQWNTITHTNVLVCWYDYINISAKWLSFTEVTYFFISLNPCFHDPWW